MSNTHPDKSSPLIDSDALAKLQAWQGRSETLVDDITAAPVRALSATLDRDDALPVAGTHLPALWHWLYFLPHHRQSEIGDDGHAKRGGFLPPVPLPRRMWAGGRLSWESGNPLQVGDKIERTSTIVSVTHKAGRSGELVFVLVRHEVRNARGLALTEEHDIVYRAAAEPGEKAPPPTPAPKDATFSRNIVPDDVLLFRYSALTFNGHRIHYDRRYVTQVEGYPGLIVHGPLIATLLVDLLRRNLPGAQLARFEFRAVRPTFDIAPFRVHGKPAEGSSDGKTFSLWGEDADGWLTMQATAVLA
ncbi:MaoC family dehydratase N-terminal domain-containing protein [Variovorax sp. PAMC26660]|uniref:FAS1-like dehydratase domain-containing protein n=1 Tax=Variovorax sp. PAMC26660 TaxID=2762322 RepID=UPI00164D48AB|nr:MaoC family dehydratase N-terminal domain-containing protein [Variovorax sp. PAMC26660]QNK66599.1 MaoC family dehydratase N-terminal domain-containing protein [Variovorax sp. PAMC26660]